MDEMAFEQKVNTAGLFANTKAPDKSDYNAHIDVECPHCGKTTAFWLNGWRKVTKAGAQFISLKLRAKVAPRGEN
jgi:hypothetical protein